MDQFSGDLHEMRWPMAARSDIDYVDISTVSLQDVITEYNVPLIDF